MGLSLAHFGRGLRSSENWERGKIFVFLWGKQHMILLISHRPNFMKFEHSMSIGEALIPFRTEFWKFFRKGSFFQKCKKNQHFSNIMWLQATITLQWLQIDGNSLPNEPPTGCIVSILESVQSFPWPVHSVQDSYPKSFLHCQTQMHHHSMLQCHSNELTV